MASFDRSHTSSYLSFIVNRSLSCAVTEIFGVEYWRDLEIWVMSRSMSLKMAPIDRSFAAYYWSAIVTVALSRTILLLFDFEYSYDLEM